MIRLMIITEFYVAHAYDKVLSPEDIVETVDSLKEAERLAYDRFSGHGDDVCVFIKVNDVWYFVYGRDRLSDHLVVSEYADSTSVAYVSEWY